jgi:hypothetical protein
MDQSRGGLSIPIQIPLDDEHYLDRQCPSVNCQSSFRVLFEDWKEKVSDVRVFCPICREEAKATEWNTPDQAEYIKQVGLRHIQGLIGEAMARALFSFLCHTDLGPPLWWFRSVLQRNWNKNSLA